MTAVLALLRSQDAIITGLGTPTLKFQNDWQKQAEMVEGKLGSSGVTLTNAANDAAAAAAGIPVGSFYRNGSVVMLRVV